MHDLFEDGEASLHFAVERWKNWHTEASFEQRNIIQFVLGSLNVTIDLVATTLKEDAGFAVDVKEAHVRVFGK